MNGSKTPSLRLAALLHTPLFTLSLALACITPCSAALAAGALPWLAPGQQENASATDSSITLPDDPSAKAQFELLRQFFRRQMTLAEDFPELFSRRVKDSETLAFLAMCETQRKRGLLARFRAAEVDLEGLTFTRVTSDPDLARIRVTGWYSFTLGAKARTGVEPNTPPPPESTVRETLKEDALFVLLPEMGEWKIYERREGWSP
jgi:hypothetical protein